MWKKGDVPASYHKMMTPNGVDFPLHSLSGLKKTALTGGLFV